MLGLRAEAGVCARRRSNFLLPRQEKVTKEKAPLLCVSLRCAAGNLRCSGRGCAAELTARLRRSARTTAVSQCMKCVCPSAHARTPCPALLGTHRREPNGIGHPFGPSLRSVQNAQALRAATARPSAAMARVAVGMFGCPTPAGCACGGAVAGWHARRSARASSTDSPWLSERRAQRKASSTEHPATDTTQVCPAAQRRGRRLGVAFLLLTFLWRSKEK